MFMIFWIILNRGKIIYIYLILATCRPSLPIAARIAAGAQMSHFLIRVTCTYASWFPCNAQQCHIDWSLWQLEARNCLAISGRQCVVIVQPKHHCARHCGVSVGWSFCGNWTPLCKAHNGVIDWKSLAIGSQKLSQLTLTTSQALKPAPPALVIAMPAPRAPWRECYL